MKKVCILSAVNIRHMSLISLYTSRLKKDNIDYDIIYMDKYGEEEEFDAKNKYVFTNIINPADNKVKKALQYFKFRKFAIPILEKHKYDFIIVWNDVAIFMFADYLAKKWKGQYCLNIRDYFGQNNSYIYRRFKKVINNSAFTTISSEGFKSFLPSHNYIHVHSLNPEVMSAIKPKNSFKDTNQPIKITFIGNVRFYELNKKLLSIFKNDHRFEMHYYGTNSEKLKSYAEENNIRNTDFYGTFPVKETAKYIYNTDLINNLYGSGSMALDYALSIKLYHGIYSRSPILVNSGTYSGEFVKDNGIGFVVDKIDENLPDKLYDWYSQLNFDKFNNNCEILLNEIEKDNENFNSIYERYIGNRVSSV